MSKDKKGGDKPVAPGVSGPIKCTVDGCKEHIQRLSFCNVHFDWFKEGLVNKRGEKPTDFDKKYVAYKRRIAA